MMQQMDPTWHPHMKLEYFKTCVRLTMMTLGQMTSSVEKQSNEKGELSRINASCLALNNINLTYIICFIQVS